jgi:hypothetical protein
VLKRLEALIEQTDFLLEKQNEALAESERIFGEMASDVEEMLKNKSIQGQELTSLNNILTMIKDHLENVNEQMQEDIDFLTEQLAALKHITAIPDQAKAKELLNLMIDEDEEILETEEFKENVTQESATSKQNLISIIDDLKAALKENKFREIELFLEALSQEEDEETEETEEESDCECCESKCNSKKKSCCSGVDIFKCACGDDKCTCGDDCDDDCCK